MRIVRLVVIVGVVSVFLTQSAAAQDASRVGVIMGFPSSVGLVFQASDKLAVRPEFSFSSGSGEVTTTGPIVNTTPVTSDTSTLGIGVSGLFYLRKWDALRTYVSPRYNYSRNSSESTSSVSATDVSGSAHIVTGSFGAEYAFGRRFAVFGEVGLAYSHSTLTSTATVTRSESKTNSVGSRTGVGAVFYF